MCWIQPYLFPSYLFTILHSVVGLPFNVANALIHPTICNLDISSAKHWNCKQNVQIVNTSNGIADTGLVYCKAISCLAHSW